MLKVAKMQVLRIKVAEKQGFEVKSSTNVVFIMCKNVKSGRKVVYYKCKKWLKVAEKQVF